MMILVTSKCGATRKRLLAVRVGTFVRALARVNTAVARK